ncbi:MAG: penicillin acylase family protein [Calditrichota bacterium]
MKVKIFLGILLILVFIIISFGIFVLIQVRQMKPDYQGNYQIEGITNPVNISWDSLGVIHISGETTSDVVFASGYASAHERLWQIEMTRRVAKGKLSEIFGDQTVELDKLFRTIGLDSLAGYQYKRLSQESQLWLTEYAKGINAFIKQTGNNLPLEFILVGMKPEAWTPEDCLLQNRLMAWFLNFNWKADLLYWALYSKLPQDKFMEIWPRSENYPTIAKIQGIQPILNKLMNTNLLASNYLNFDITAAGSNSWVIGPQKSKSGYALLANDPHLRLQIPSLWIEMQLHSNNLNVAGFALPGSPGIIIGRNESISWGLTNGMVDDCDFFVEKIDTVGNTYREDNQNIPLRLVEVIIKVKDKPDILYTIYGTDNGPVLNTAFAGITSSAFLSMKWSGWGSSDELFTIISLAKAGNWKDFDNALRTFSVPAQNFVYADKKGNIGYRLGGRIPMRSYKNGLLPQDGSTSKNKWTGWVPFDKMPQLINPAKGWIATANNPVMKNFPYYVSELWEPPYRIRRIEQLIQMQCDSKNLLAIDLIPSILSELEFYDPRDDEEESALLLLKYWNNEMSTEAVPASVYETIQYFIIKNIFEDEMGNQLFNVFVDLPNFYLRILMQVFQNKDSAWFDNVNTSEQETRNDIVIKSFQNAIDFLRSKYQNKMEDWEWGMVHTLELEHVLGKTALTRRLFNRGPYQVPGDGVTVNVGTYPFSKPFHMSIGPSLRFVMDWASPENYYSIIPGGTSGNFLSNYYDNQIQFWLNGELKQVRMSGFKSGNKIQLFPEKE